MKTSAEIAKELNLTKSQVYQYLHRNNIKPSRKKGNKYYYSNEAIRSVSKHFKNASSNSKSAYKSHNSSDNKQSDSLAVKALMKQLEEKDKQIEKLTKLLDQQQQLNLLSAKNSSNSRKALQSDSKQNEAEKGFWYKLFH